MRRVWPIGRTTGLAVVALLAASATMYGAIVGTIVAFGTASYVEELEGPGDLTFQTLTIGPGDVSVWHRHLGQVYLVVKSGTVTLESPCGGTEVYTAGQAFVEYPGHVHRAANYETVPAILELLYVVPAGSPRSIAVSAPVCIGPPATAEACMAEGWQTFTVPRMFKNQGDCVSWVESGRR